MVKNTLERLQTDFKKELQSIKNAKEAEQLKVKYLGKKGVIQELMVSLKDASYDERPSLGKLINTFKSEIEVLIEKAWQAFGDLELEKRLIQEKVDTSLPGRRLSLGRAHPVTLVKQHMIDILKEMGFSVQYGPDVESDYYNFEGLNYPKDHPARDMQDTFYVNAEYLLRSHTTNTQLRIMEVTKPPIRVISPGTAYRNENISARSHVFFHQIDGLYIDEKVSFADLLSTLRQFWNKVFSKEVKIRFRPSFFPFTEPSLEADIACTSCGGEGCPLCKNTGWLEVIGAGMVHPEVLKNGGIDPEKYSGFAWGLGIERVTMLLYGVKDIRDFTENDMRFLSQF
jgi:phenylalanyl-tRNA synthetase alpha chain